LAKYKKTWGNKASFAENEGMVSAALHTITRSKTSNDRSTGSGCLVGCIFSSSLLESAVFPFCPILINVDG